MIVAIRKRRQISRQKAGLVLVTLEIPAALRQPIEEMADRMVKEWEQREALYCGPKVERVA
jgi:hypothetical protein